MVDRRTDPLVQATRTRHSEQGTVELPKTDGEAVHVTIDSVVLAAWIAGVSLQAAKTRCKRMKV